MTWKSFTGFKGYPFWLAGAASCLFVFNVRRSIQFEPAAEMAGLVHRYWADFWLTSYGTGFSRRALLGEVISWLFGAQIGYLPLNLIALGFVGFILAVTYGSYVRTVLGGLTAPAVFVACGPLSMVFFEVLGDPLHFALVVLLLYGWVSRQSSKQVSLVLAVVAGMLSMLIHEGSAFLLLPAIYSIHCINSNARIRPLVSVGVMLFAVAAITLLASNQAPRVLGAQLVLSSGEAVSPTVEALPPFGILLQQELAVRFGSLGAIVTTAGCILRTLIWPLAAIVALTAWARDRHLARYVLFLFAHSIPLYVVAHDWGRFSIYTLLLGLVLSALAQRQSTDLSLAWLQLPQLRNRRLIPYAASAAAVVLLMYAAHSAYRLSGSTSANVVHAGLVAIVVMVWLKHSSWAERSDLLIK